MVEGIGGYLAKGLKGLKAAAGATCTPADDVKLHKYKVQVTMSVEAVDIKTARKAADELKKQLPDWAPALLGLLGVADKMKITGIEAEVATKKKSKKKPEKKKGAEPAADEKTPEAGDGQS